MSVHYGKASPSSMSNVMLFLMLCKIGLRQKLQTFPGKMVNTLHSDEEKGIQDKESKEESILAMLGIIGTILNLVVIIFVYIYTTL
ncbi:protein TUNAR [Cebidichthys violaceus]|uniref:protein TUNAR n=1 Tax=Cebidichthys violaceus TaxID=271503 RepID=UPI0035CAA731